MHERPQQTSRLIGRGLTVKRSGKTILSGVDFVGEPGELIGVLGPSGSGKSTLLYALSGFRPANDGGVSFGGADLYKGFESIKGEIGFVPQDDIVPASLRVERVMHFAAELRLPDLTSEVREGRINGILVRLGLSEHRRKRVSQLSGGQRKRVSVAVELLSRPNVLFADEPTSGLDPALESELTKTFRSMTAGGRIVITTTHIMTSLKLLDRVYVIHQGHLVYCGPPAELKPYFGVEDFHEIYHALGKESGAVWHKRFKASPMHARYLR